MAATPAFWFKASLAMVGPGRWCRRRAVAAWTCYGPWARLAGDLVVLTFPLRQVMPSLVWARSQWRQRGWSSVSSRYGSAAARSRRHDHRPILIGCSSFSFIASCQKTVAISSPIVARSLPHSAERRLEVARQLREQAEAPRGSCSYYRRATAGRSNHQHLTTTIATDSLETTHAPRDRRDLERNRPPTSLGVARRSAGAERDAAATSRQSGKPP
jgi:hypothetical protein